MSPTYKSWARMMTRCGNPNVGDFRHYGGRGITVDPAWHSFEVFLADMGERPPEMTIDRIDGTKPYEPGNCRWATRRDQAINRRSTVWLDYRGERLTMTELAMRVGIHYDTLRTRLKNGWPIEQALDLRHGNSRYRSASRNPKSRDQRI
jgi:hypothetical protein